MEIPPFHVCQALTHENEVINAKYRKLTRKYKELQKEVLELQEKLTRFQIEREYTTLYSNALPIKKPSHPKIEIESKKDISTEKLLSLHNKLLKQFEKETKQNSNQAKKLRKLEMDNEKLKDDLFNSNQQMDYMKKQIIDKENQLQLISLKVKTSNTPRQDHNELVTRLTREKKKLIADNKRLRGELQGLDRGFFDEIEDMKYALQQSARLNTEYEKAIRKLCKQYGVNYQSAFTSSVKKETSEKRRRRSSQGRRKSES